jgi:hypothetical protein
LEEFFPVGNFFLLSRRNHFIFLYLLLA